MADIFDVVSDGTRRRLLRVLLDRSRRGGDVSVGEIVTELDLSQPTVSKHLKVLRDHGLVAVREEGQHRYYRIDAEPLAEVEEWLAPFRGIRPALGRVPSVDANAPTIAPAPVEPSAAWAVATASAEAAGRAAASIAHVVQSGVSRWQTGVDVIERRVEAGYRRTAENVARLRERLPFD